MDTANRSNMRKNMSNMSNVTNNDEFVEKHMGMCYHYKSHHNIAALVYKLYKNKFRYRGRGQWDYLDVDGEWKVDRKTMKLRNELRSYVSNLFLQKYLSVSGNPGYFEYHMEDRAIEILRVSYKLKMNTFMSTIIKEASAFFDIYNDDQSE